MLKVKATPRGAKVVLQCDSPHCGTRSLPFFAKSVASVLEWTAREAPEGWQQRDGRTLCPSCGRAAMERGTFPGEQSR